MGNLARKEDLDQAISAFMLEISRLADRQQLSDACHRFLYKFPPQRALEVVSMLTYSNPFFLANIPAENVRQLTVNLDLFAEMVMRAKLTASRAQQLNVLVACAPKSASTFIQSALISGLRLPSAGLFTATLTAESGSMLGANLKEQDIDELALIRGGLNRAGYVAQHHARCSPYLAEMLSLYNVKPIVTHRNILDTIISMDDMLMGWRRMEATNISFYFNDGMPENFHKRERADRLMMLAQRLTGWLVQFFVTWKKCERFGLVKPLWISYEDDFLGDKQILAARVATYVGADFATAARLASAFEDRSNADAKRLNKGVAGRGKDIPEKVRDQVMRIASYYRDEEDLSPLLGN